MFLGIQKAQLSWGPGNDQWAPSILMRILTLCFISSSKKPKKRPEVAVRPKPAPRLTIFDEEVDPDAGLFSSDKKVSETRRPLETTQDCKY